MINIIGTSIFLQDHIDKLSLSGEEVKSYQMASWRRWQQYVEPGDEQVRYLHTDLWYLVDNLILSDSGRNRS